jgi:hypothetical protein
VYDSIDTAEFEHKWSNFYEKIQPLTQCAWFDELYKIRATWVPAYVKDHFWAGMSTTQRSESMNSFFDGYINSKTSLRAFVSKYDVALHAKWEKEKQEDYRCKHMSPKLITNCTFEKQFADKYTFKMFHRYQHEIKMLITCSCHILSTNGPIFHLQILDIATNKFCNVTTNIQT